MSQNLKPGTRVRLIRPDSTWDNPQAGEPQYGDIGIVIGPVEDCRVPCTLVDWGTERIETYTVCLEPITDDYDGNTVTDQSARSFVESLADRVKA